MMAGGGGALGREAEREKGFKASVFEAESDL